MDHRIVYFGWLLIGAFLSLFTLGCDTTGERDTIADAEVDRGFEITGPANTSLSGEDTANSQSPRLDAPGRTASASNQESGSSNAEELEAKTPSEPIDFLAIEQKISKAENLARSGKYSQAAVIALEISRQPIPDPVSPMMKAFDWYLRDLKLERAEAVCRLAIQRAPGDARAHRALAQLLNGEGRRYEASQHVTELIRLGAALPREVLSLIDLSGPFELVSFKGAVGDAKGSMFDLGVARRRFVAEGKPEEALLILDDLLKVKKHPAIAALQGRILAEKVELERLALWASELPEGTDDYPGYWLAIGLWCVHQEQDRAAIRAFAETLSLDPTNRRAVRAMAAAFGRLGKTELARQAQNNLGVLDSIFRDASSADAKQSMQIGTELIRFQRLWESVFWFRQSFEMAGVLEQQADELNNRVGQIRNWESQMEPSELERSRVEKSYGFELNDYPIVATSDLIAMTRRETTPRDVAVGQSDSESALRFEDVASKLKLKTTFVSDYPMDKVDFWLYQANGGGLGAIDFDLDGNQELYVVQSGGNPRVTGSSQPNQLFRNLDAESFVDVSIESDVQDRGYGQGICVADLNQDGWSDLVIANIGRNAVYFNQGDGTFRQASEDYWPDDPGSWTSSIAVGDLDGDQLPEMVEINYLDDPQIFARKCVGKQLDCTPQRFRAAVDQFYRVEDDGKLKPWSGAEGFAEKPNYGFGAVLANIDGQQGNDLFISNDGDVNHLWRSRGNGQPVADKKTGKSSSDYVLSEVGAISGCSIGISGLSQACMGIASGDFDRNGTFDLLITNFYNEPLNLFLQMSPGLFVDESLKYGMSETAKDVLGFGVQAADFDNDGWLDAAVGNGHLYDARYADIPFKMQSQLYRGSPKGFLLQNESTAGVYWKRKHLARTLVTFDYDSDGRMDLVSNHLDQPIGLLRNQTETGGNWLQIELQGIQSERDATGAPVTVVRGEDRWVTWVTAGDGYMCTNESVLHFGVGDYQEIDRIEIDWPSGNRQVTEPVRVNQRFLVVEGQPVFAR